MAVTLFVLVESSGAGLPDPDVARIEDLVRGLSGLGEALLYRPVQNAPDHPFAADGPGPALALELGFDSLGDAEAALQPGRLGELSVPGLPDARIAHQMMTPRHFPVDDPVFRPPAGGEPCTFMVHYPGPAPDQAAWLDHYDAHHPPIMRRFPGIRQVATYRPLEWRSSLGWARADAMQRNKVAFDSPAALAAALASPVMAEMRADRDTFPASDGLASHYPMRTRIVR